MSARWLGLCSLFILLYAVRAHAQNLAPNPSFETYINCPASYSCVDDYNPMFPVNSLQSWYRPTDATSDYFNSCDATGYVSTPYSVLFLNYQVPHSGNAYAGLIPIYVNSFFDPYYAEYLMCRLTGTLTANHHYFVQYYVSETTQANEPTEQMGAYFSPNVLSLATFDATGIATYAPLSVTPQVESPPGFLFSDTLNWMPVSGTFIAAGNEQWMTLGKFRHPGAAFPDSLGDAYEYLMVDDVCVLDLDAPGVLDKDTSICFTPGGMLIQGYAAGDHFKWNTGDTTASITATSTGTYWRTTITGCAARVDTIRLVAYIPVTIGNDTFFCEGNSSILKDGHNYPQYTWSTGATGNSITVTQAGQYILTASNGLGCAGADTVIVSLLAPPPPPVIQPVSACLHDSLVTFSATGQNLTWHQVLNDTGTALPPVINTDNTGTQTMFVTQQASGCVSAPAIATVTVNAPPVITLPADTALCDGQSLQLSVIVPAGSFRWNTGDTACCITVNTAGTYTIQVTTGSCTASGATTVTVAACAPCIAVPTAFTPNGDGQNDIFKPVVSCTIKRYRMIIVDRWGQKIFESINPQEGWNGSHNAYKPDLGTYGWLIRYTPDYPGATEETLHGDVLLVR